ncbi:hypothetical protein TNCV_497551 [Trichonephila clavipes]|nr:hypothetical protein TNCV_497551 [Trichonephila clavipes]
MIANPIGPVNGHWQPMYGTWCNIPLYYLSAKLSDRVESPSLHSFSFSFGLLRRYTKIECTTIGFPIHSSQVNTPLHTPKITPPSTPKSTTKRKDDEFQSPPSRKTARHVLLETPQYMDLNLENLFSFPSFNESDFPTLHTTQHNIIQNPTLNDSSAPRTQVGVTTSSSQNNLSQVQPVHGPATLRTQTGVTQPRPLKTLLHKNCRCHHLIYLKLHSTTVNN